MWYVVVGLIGTFLLGVLGGGVLVRKTLSEFAEALVVLAEAIKQGDFSPEKLKEIVEEFNDVVVAALSVIRR